MKLSSPFGAVGGFGFGLACVQRASYERSGDRTGDAPVGLHPPRRR